MKTDLKSFINDIVDFPKAGIVFKDISPLLRAPAALAQTIELFRREWEGKIDAIAALDARGFIFGSILAYAMGLPLVMLRKKGKLPGKTHGVVYDLEYGSAELEVQLDALGCNARVLVVDDLLATGGTAVAACELIEKAGAKVAGCAFVIELDGLGGREALAGKNLQSLVVYGKEVA
jgi:adenine phosphoribosyltransferase